MICGKFHQNRSIRLGCRDDTHTQTHITDRQTHTHTLGSIATYSVKLTENKNQWGEKPLSSFFAVFLLSFKAFRTATWFRRNRNINDIGLIWICACISVPSFSFCWRRRIRIAWLFWLWRRHNFSCDEFIHFFPLLFTKKHTHTFQYVYSIVQPYAQLKPKLASVLHKVRGLFLELPRGLPRFQFPWSLAVHADRL